jgi:FkbM family methyltransferase
LARSVVVIRSIAVRLPVMYRALQSGRAWRIRGAIRPSYEPEFQALPEVLPRSRVRAVVDVGANFGQSIVALGRVYPAAAITAFEPNAQVAQVLRKRFVDRDGIHVHVVGLGSEPGAAVLHVPSYNGIPFPGLASLDASGAHRWFSSETILGYREKLFREDLIPVRIERLDDQVTSADLIKIDVEGHEVDVLTGGLRLITGARPALLVECSGTFHDVCDLLAPDGYRPMELGQGHWVASRGRRLNQLFLASGNA